MFAPGRLLPRADADGDVRAGHAQRRARADEQEARASRSSRRNDCHYVNRSDAAAHDVLMAIQTGKSLKDEKRLKHVVDSYYMKSPSEMDARVQGRRRGDREHREDRRAVQRQAQARSDATCRNYKVPDGETLDTYIASSIDKGLERAVPRVRRARHRVRSGRSIASAARPSWPSSRRWASRATS